MGARIREDKGGSGLGARMREDNGRGGMGPRVREDKGGGVGLALAGDAADGEREGEDGSPPSRGQREGHIEGSIYKLVGPRMREDKGGWAWRA